MPNPPGSFPWKELPPRAGEDGFAERLIALHELSCGLPQRPPVQLNHLPVALILFLQTVKLIFGDGDFTFIF